jgi:glycerol-3-phosphate acyltransferase PlsY
MIDIATILASLVAGYLLGSISTAIVVGKMYGKDIRSLGSSNAGLTNTLRVLGKFAALLVLAGDVLKGVLACRTGLLLGAYVASADAAPSACLLAAGAGAVIGHNWPLYFGFRGGKGILTAVTVLFMVDWIMALASLAVFAIVVGLTRYVSLASVLATAFVVAISFLPAAENTAPFQVFAWTMATIIVFRHRENIRRLLAGTENRLTY